MRQTATFNAIQRHEKSKKKAKKKQEKSKGFSPLCFGGCVVKKIYDAIYVRGYLCGN